MALSSLRDDQRSPWSFHARSDVSGKDHRTGIYAERAPANDVPQHLPLRSVWKEPMLTSILTVLAFFTGRWYQARKIRRLLTLH
jgi:hypothetical protein